MNLAFSILLMERIGSFYQMAEFLFKRSDYVHSDPEKDRRGVHKKTDFINWKPDGFSNFSHGNGPGSYLNDFIIIKVPGISLSEAEASDHLRSWKDDLGYEITATRPAQGQYDIRIFEKNTGAISQNAIAGVKATKVRDYLLAWGCSNFAISATDGSFTFSLWDAVRSANFWDVPLIGTKVSFTLNSYSGATGIGNITVVALAGQWGDQTGAQISQTITRKITEKGGTIVSQVYPDFVFEIERSDILTRFKADVKQRLEQVYMRHQYGISQADHDAIVAAGGIVTMTKAEFLGKLIDKMAG
jgi:hypothetical protein